jgi:phosphate-selective porin OprO/OprP
LSGDLLNKKLNYAVGIFNGVADGGENTTTQDINSAKEYSGRIFTTPFADSDSALRGLGFGIAGTTGNSNGIANKSTVTSNLASYKTPGQANSFFNFRSKAVTSTSTDISSAADNVVANGSRVRLSPQAYYYNGPVGIIAEYASVEQGVKIGTTPGGAKTFKNEAWQLAGSWLLTGEDASFKGVKPYSPFSTNGGWGAWELVARYQENNIDKAAVDTVFIDPAKANAGSAKTWGAGVNWYLNQSSKFAFNLEETRFSGGIGAGSLTGKKETFAVARYQLAF